MEPTPKTKINDSVFTHLFGQKKYQRELYLALHPGEDISEQDLETVTLENVIADDIYNDLGFIARNTLITLVEAQSTWNWNMALRFLMYYTQTIKDDYVGVDSKKLYNAGAIKIPRPEFYVVFTGGRVDKPGTITLSGAHWDGIPSDIEITVHMIYGSDENDILSQYVRFTKVVKKYEKELGKTNEAIKQAIAECKENDILKDYLSEHESEVYDIMTTLFNQESITKQYGDERYQLGDAHRLVVSIDNIMSTLNLSLPDACSAMHCSILEYQQAKQMINEHGNIL